MARKIKFAMKMRDDVEVRTLSELKEHFDLERVMAYYLDGKLDIWLADRYYDELYDSIQELDRDAPDLGRRLCELFGVDYEDDALSVEEIEERNRKISLLKEITDDEEIIENIDSVAFSQEELADLLDEGKDTIYLCGEDFQIPTKRGNITYIGIDTKLSVSKKIQEKYVKNNIRLINLLEEDINVAPVEMVTENYQRPRIINNEIEANLEKIKKILEKYLDEEYRITVGLGCSIYLHNSEMHYRKDDIHSKSKAVKLAEERLFKVYNLITDCFDKYADDNFSEKVQKKFFNSIKTDIIEIQNILENLDEEVKTKNSIILKHLYEMINLDNLKLEVQEIAEEVLDDDSFQFPSFYEYTGDIYYEEVGLDGLFGKKDYWFDASTPFMRMTEELNSKSDWYEELVSLRIKTRVVQPIVDTILKICP